MRRVSSGRPALRSRTTIVPERLIALLSGVFGALGSLLVAIGMYGLLAYTVTRRINEIGIRVALGATQTAISRMVLREALGMTCGGLIVGAPVAYCGQLFAATLIEPSPPPCPPPKSVSIRAPHSASDGPLRTVTGTRN